MFIWCLKTISRGIVFICGISFAILGILGQISIMPQHSLGLIVTLYAFIIASCLLWWFGREPRPTGKENPKQHEG